MHNYEHKKLVEKITKLDEAPIDSQDFSEWMKAGAHLEFLRQNELADELAISVSDCSVSGKCFFVHSVAVRNDKLSRVNQDDLVLCNFNPYIGSIASYERGERDDVRIKRSLSGTSTKTLEDAAVQLVFGRKFKVRTRPGGDYYELRQEYAHLSNIHWHPEMRAYCRFDEHGDLEPVVSITTREDKGSSVDLVSFKWEPLEEYLVASNASLVRKFDFTFRQKGFPGWNGLPQQKFYDSDRLFYRQTVMPTDAIRTHGVQIIRPRRSKKTVFASIIDNWSGQKNRKYAEFDAYDLRNRRMAKISTDPNATTNYFNAEGNSLPFEVSPAFFSPEVLLRYKADSDKYTVGERDISCGTAWHLGKIDVNEAGQVHAYICELRHLPYKEQLYWLSFNERPKALISQRAIINDFKGEWGGSIGPLQKVLSVIWCWHDNKVAWWTLRDTKLPKRVNTPLTASRDEWAEAFMDLAKLVVEGFETKPIRAKLDAAQIPYDKEDKTIALLEKLLNKGDTSDKAQKLVGLRTVQSLRSKAKGHVGGSEAEKLAQDALMEHETFGNHFNHVCTQVANDLETIKQLMK